MGKSFAHPKSTAAGLEECQKYRSFEKQDAAQNSAARVSEAKVKWKGEVTIWRKDEKNAREDLEKPKVKQQEEIPDENAR